MNNNNFVTPAAQSNTNNNQSIVPVSARRIVVDPSQIFAEPATKQQPTIDYVGQGIGFNLKYASLFVIEAILAYSVAAKFGQDFWFGTVLFGVIAFIGYWMLGFMENIFEPTSGHVIRSYYGAKVIIADIQSNERIQVSYHQTRQKELENERLEREERMMRRVELVEKVSKPQGQMNMLTTFDDELQETEPMYAMKPNGMTIDLSALERPDFLKKDDATERVLNTLLDFLLKLYESLNSENPMIKPDGVFVRTTQAPWSKRGIDSDGKNVPEPIKRRMRDVINQTTPRLFKYDEASTTWSLNLEDYPNYEDACDTLESTVVRKV